VGSKAKNTSAGEDQQKFTAMLRQVIEPEDGNLNICRNVGSLVPRAEATYNAAATKIKPFIMPHTLACFLGTLPSC
jgi:hypothetical protein